MEAEADPAKVKFFKDQQRTRAFFNPGSVNYSVGTFKSGWMVFTQVGGPRRGGGKRWSVGYQFQTLAHSSPNPDPWHRRALRRTLALTLTPDPWRMAQAHSNPNPDP